VTVAAVGLLLVLVDHSACPTGTGKLACKHSGLTQDATSRVITVILQVRRLYKTSLHHLLCISSMNLRKVSNVDNRIGGSKST